MRPSHKLRTPAAPQAHFTFHLQQRGGEAEEDGSGARGDILSGAGDPQDPQVALTSVLRSVSLLCDLKEGTVKASACGAAASHAADTQPA